MRPSRTTVGAVVALCLFLTPVAAACDSDDDTATTTDRPATSLATTADTTTDTTAPTDPATTTSAAPPAPTTSAVTTTVDTNTLASGSGCSPGAGALGDGEWYGLVAGAADGEIEFDLACWFVGDAAIVASAADGQESPPPNDYYIRNTNPALRTVPVADDAQVTWLANVGDISSAVTTDYPTWLTEREVRGIELQPGVWIVITGGAITTIEEQYVP
jgi:hypothetical protein